MIKTVIQMIKSVYFEAQLVDVWLTGRIFGEEESRQLDFCNFQVIQAAKD